MFNNEDFRAMTGKQTYKLSKKTEETFFTAKFKKIYIFYYSFSNSLKVKRRFPIMVTYDDSLRKIRSPGTPSNAHSAVAVVSMYGFIYLLLYFIIHCFMEESIHFPFSIIIYYHY